MNCGIIKNVKTYFEVLLNMSYKKVKHFLCSLGAKHITENILKELKINKIEYIYFVKERYKIKCNYEQDIIDLEKEFDDKYSLIYEEIEKTLDTTPEKLITAFGIPRLNKTIAKSICKYFKDEKPEKILGKFFDKPINILEKISGIGPITAKNIIKYRKKYETLYYFLSNLGLGFKDGNV